MTNGDQVLDDAIGVLRRGEALTHDAVARAAGLTKPGLVHYFGTKEALAVAVVDRVVDLWEAELLSRVDAGADAIAKLRAYVDYALTGTFDQSDLVLFADVKLRERLSDRWAQRLAPWFGDEVEGTSEQRASLRAARLLADGAWFNQALGIAATREDERAQVHAIAMQLIDTGVDG